MTLPKRRRARLAVAGALLVAIDMPCAFAARPMATDDTSTAPAGSCQIEAWSDRSDVSRALTLAPACGLPGGFELDTSFSSVEHEQPLVSTAGVGLKWVPESARFGTPLGTLRFGGIALATTARDPVLGWRGDVAALVGLASLAPLPTLNLYLNGFVAHRLSDGPHLTGTRAALAWQPDARWLLFAEHLRTNDGERVGNAGLRFWLRRKRSGWTWWARARRPRAGR